MADALALSAMDSQGATLWRPHRLEDLMDLPWRVMPLWEAIQSGIAARARPWSWWARGDRRVGHRAHLYPASLSGRPETAARCGHDPALDPRERDHDWYQPEGAHLHPCPECEQIAAGRTTPETEDPD